MIYKIIRKIVDQNYYIFDNRKLFEFIAMSDKEMLGKLLKNLGNFEVV
jgi:hypothetical protein